MNMYIFMNIFGNRSIKHLFFYSIISAVTPPAKWPILCCVRR